MPDWAGTGTDIPVPSNLAFDNRKVENFTVDSPMNRRPERVKNPFRQNRRLGQVPTYEECLTLFFDLIAYNADSRPSANSVSATEKRRFRRFDRNPSGLDISAYQKIIRRLLDQHSKTIQALGEPWSDILEDELRQIMGRYEHLLLSLTHGNADARQVRWSLCVRFFAPWAALRIAFRLRLLARPRSPEWFVPRISGNAVSSCFMRIIDEKVKREAETDTDLALRLCKGAAGYKQDMASGLTRNFRNYRNGSDTASDPTLTMILKTKPHLRSILVMARAIDRIILRGRKTFGADEMAKLVTFFQLSFSHFTLLLQRLRTELPDDDGQAWLYLQSQTFTGNTPFEAERYWPLTELYPYRLARKISDELQSAAPNGELAYVPTSQMDFEGGAFGLPDWTPLPDKIQEAVRNRNYRAAVEASLSLFTSKSPNPKQAMYVAEFFSHTALMAYDPDTARSPLVAPESDLPNVLEEAERLFGLACQQVKGAKKAEYEIEHLRFLLAPQRPKKKTERALARMLYRTVDKFYRDSGRSGSSLYLLGCLLWLEGNKKQAGRVFLSAVELGRASFAEYDWIHLLRQAPILATQIPNKRALNRFLKISEVEGVLYGEPSPRTNLFEKEKRQHMSAQKFRFTFKPFPD